MNIHTCQLFHAIQPPFFLVVDTPFLALGFTGVKGEKPKFKSGHVVSCPSKSTHNRFRPRLHNRHQITSVSFIAVHFHPRPGLQLQTAISRSVSLEGSFQCLLSSFQSVIYCLSHLCSSASPSSLVRLHKESWNGDKEYNLRLKGDSPSKAPSGDRELIFSRQE